MTLPRWVTWPVLLAVAGVAAGLGQSPWGLWPLALAGWGLGIALVAGSGLPALSGWFLGVVHFSVTLHWLVEPFMIDPAATGWLAPIALGSAAAGLSLFWALGASIGARAGGPVGVAAGLAGAELARAYALTGFPWALPGHVLIDSPALASASLLGAHGMGLCLLLGLGMILTWRPVVAALGVTLVAAPFALSVTVPQPDAPAQDAPVIRLVQPNAPQHQKWDPDFMGIFFRRGLEATAALGAVDLTLWPETSMPTLLDRSQDVRPIIATAAGGGPVLLGAQRYDAEGRPRNAAVLLTGPEGEVSYVYDKHRLAPFGEYLPLPWLADALGIGPLAAQLAGRFVPGQGPDTFEVEGVGRILPLICYEAIFPQDLRRTERPRVILHLTNDAWFGTGAGPRQHLALSRLRAAETALPVLRAANTGISAAIDSRGTVLARLGLGEVGHLDVVLPPAGSETVYLATGDWPPLVVILATLAGLGLARRRKAVDAPGNPS